MKSSLLLICAIFSTIIVVAQESSEITLGTRYAIQSELLGEERHYLINLPDSYKESPDQKYPLIILLDGYAHFKTAAGVVHFLSYDRLRIRLMPESIIVAVESIDREHDLTHTKIKTKRENTMGGGRDFLKFIEQELIPHIDKTYRTEPHRTLIGHSLGGLLTINAYRDANSLFDAYIAMDPAIWWDEELTVAKVDSISTSSFMKPLYIATANQGERNNARNKTRHDFLVAKMKEKSNGNFKVEIEYFEDENHRTVPFRALYEGLKYVNTVE